MNRPVGPGAARWALCAALGTLACFVIAACGVDDRKVSVDEGSSYQNPPSACVDVADAFAQTWERCNLGTYNEGFTTFVQSGGNGDCNTIVKIRDPASLYGECIPYWRGLPCTDVSAGNISPPDSCKGQLQFYGSDGG